MCPRTGKDLQQLQAAVTLGSRDPPGPKIAEMSVADSYLFEAFVTISESQKRPLRLGSNALPSLADNYSPFERQLLACS